MLVGGWKYKGDFTKIGNILPDSSIRGHVTKKKKEFLDERYVSP